MSTILLNKTRKKHKKQQNNAWRWQHVTNRLIRIKLGKAMLLLAKSERQDDFLFFDGEKYYVIHLTFVNTYDYN